MSDDRARKDRLWQWIAEFNEANGYDFLAFLSGEDEPYNLTHLWESSPEAGNPDLSPAAFVADEHSREFIEYAAGYLGIPESQLIFRRGGEWWAVHMVATEYAGFLSAEFRSLVIESAVQGFSEGLHLDGTLPHQRN